MMGFFFENYRDVVGQRLDPHFHLPTFKSLLDKVKRLPYVRLGEIVRLSKEQWDQKSDFLEDFPYIEIAKIDLLLGKLTELSFVPVSEAPSRAKMIVREDDLLVSLTRPTRGAICRVTENEDGAIASNGFAVIRSVDECRALRSFLFHLLRSQICLDQFGRHSSGGNYPAMSETALLDVLVPLPDIEAQREIAERLDVSYQAVEGSFAEASRLLSSIDDLLSDELGIFRLPAQADGLQDRIYFRRFAELSGQRFDPIAHQEIKRALVSAIESSCYPVLPFRDLVCQSNDIAKAMEESERYVGLENIDGESGDYCETSEKDSFGTAGRFKQGQILFPKLRPYLNKTHLAKFDGICSTEFHIFTAMGIRPDYLTAFLRSRAIVGITSQLMTGNTLPRLQMCDIDRLPIPVPPLEKQEQLCFEIELLRDRARKLREQARADLHRAKADIENLILG